MTMTSASACCFFSKIGPMPDSYHRISSNDRIRPDLKAVIFQASEEYLKLVDVDVTNNIYIFSSIVDVDDVIACMYSSIHPPEICSSNSQTNTTNLAILYTSMTSSYRCSIISISSGGEESGVQCQVEVLRSGTVCWRALAAA